MRIRLGLRSRILALTMPVVLLVSAALAGIVYLALGQVLEASARDVAQAEAVPWHGREQSVVVTSGPKDIGVALSSQVADGAKGTVSSDSGSGAKKDEDSSNKSAAKPAEGGDRPKPKYPPFAELMKDATKLVAGER